MMISWRIAPRLGLPLFLLTVAGAQTTVDLRTQSRDVDFSNASSTKPSKSGTVVPATCSVGETFFKTDADAGRNLYFCTARNTWSQMAGSPTGPAALLEVNGGGSKAQTTDGGLPANAVPVIDGSGKSVDSGCTATGGVANCPNGFTSGAGASTITMTEGVAPPAPTDGKQTLYLDVADHRAKLIDGASGVRNLATSSGSTPPGAVAAYDAAGNLTASACSLTDGVLVCGLGAGATLTIPSWFEFPAAVCQGSAAYLGFNVPAADTPAAACAAGTNTTFGVAAFTAGAQSGQIRFVLPDDWVAGAGNDLEFRFRSETAGGAGNVVWNARTACSGSSGASLDSVFNTAQTAASAAQPNNLTNKATVSGFTTTGCSPGSILFIRFGLDSSTTAAGAEDLLSLRIKLKRAISAL